MEYFIILINFLSSFKKIKVLKFGDIRKHLDFFLLLLTSSQDLDTSFKNYGTLLMIGRFK